MGQFSQKGSEIRPLVAVGVPAFLQRQCSEVSECPGHFLRVDVIDGVRPSQSVLLSTKDELLRWRPTAEVLRYGQTAQAVTRVVEIT